MLFYLISGYINLFRYLSFRSMMAGLSSFVLVVFLGPFFIEKLKKMKCGQQIREEGPSAHQTKGGTPTMGGLLIWGVCLFSILMWAAWNSFVLLICLAIFFFTLIGFIDDFSKIRRKTAKGLGAKAKLFFQTVVALILLALIYMMPQYHRKIDQMVLDLVDQNGMVLINNNVQINDPWSWDITGVTFDPEQTYKLIAKMYNPETGKFEKKTLFSLNVKDQDKSDHRFSSITLSNNQYRLVSKIMYTVIDKQGYKIKQEDIELGILYRAKLFNIFFVPYYSEVVFYWPLWLAFIFYAFIIVGVSNATNLSDGLDGLATGLGIGFYIPFGVFAYLMGNSVLSSYLFFPYMLGVGELGVVVAAIVGAFLGFLWYNVYPAQIFMGDTGSLTMGGVAATIAIMLKQELVLLIAGFIFVLETVSVILQVFWFKKFKNRIFKMAPIHHHFELIGWKENQVVVRFWIMGAFCALLALASIKIR